MRLGIENKYKILFIVFVVLAVYYPAISGGVNSLDDARIIDVYGFNGNLKLKNILLPGRSFYYRPVIEFSYYLDNLFWSMDPHSMHLENILLHAVNSVLVFLIAVQVAVSSRIRSTEFPLLASLLFALHPLHTEAVSWIAGRTDPLAALFVLLGTYHTIIYLTRINSTRDEVKSSSATIAQKLFSRHYNLLYAILCILLGCLTKEVAFFFVPGIAILAYFWPRETDPDFCNSMAKIIVAVSFGLTVFAAIILVMRLRFSSGVNSLSKLYIEGSSTLSDLGEYSLRVFGFYVKKIFFPLPLNYATVTIENYYFWIGCSAVFVIALLILKRRVDSAFLITTAILLIPAVLVAVFKIAWTPVAERYLYLPLAFFSIGFICSGYSAMEKFGNGHYVSVFLIALLMLAGVQVVQRNLVWQDNLTLYQDSVKKSPNFGRLRNELAVALFKHGRNEEGRRQLEIGRRINDSDAVDNLFLMNQIAYKLKGKTPEEQRIELLRSLSENKNINYELFSMINDINERRLLMSKDKNMQYGIARELIEINDQMYARIKEPFRLYRNGQLALIIKNNELAAQYFKEAYANAPLDAYYRFAAGKMAEKLSRK